MVKDFTNAGAKAAAAGMPIVDPTVDEAYFGGDEINVTRDLIAELNPGRRVVNAGMGPPNNADGKDGDIHFGVII